MLMRITDILMLMPRRPRDHSTIVMRRDYVRTTWRSNSDSLSLRLLPHSGANDKSNCCSEMKALAFSQTCATASTADFRLFIDLIPGPSDTCSRSEFSEEEEEEKGGNEKPVARGTRAIDKRQRSLFENNRRCDVIIKLLIARSIVSGDGAAPRIKRTAKLCHRAL